MLCEKQKRDQRKGSGLGGGLGVFDLDCGRSRISILDGQQNQDCCFHFLSFPSLFFFPWHRDLNLAASTGPSHTAQYLGECLSLPGMLRFSLLFLRGRASVVAVYAHPRCLPQTFTPDLRYFTQTSSSAAVQCRPMILRLPPQTSPPP